MQKEEIADRIFDILVEALAVPKESLTLDSRLNDDLGIQPLSTDAVDLLMKIENEFDVVISDDDYVGFSNVGDIVDYLDGYIKKQDSMNASKE